jgi:type II secretory pathway component PulC
VIATGSSRDGYAIIDELSGNSHLYRVGSLVIDGSELSEVYSDHVILLRNGLREILALPHLGVLILGGRRANMSATARDDDAVVADVTVPPKPEQMPTPGAVVHALNLRPALENGRRIGLRVNQSGYGAKPVETLGLQVGDIVTTLNGQPVGIGSGELMRAIGAGQSVDLVVQRQGQLVPVRIDPEQSEAAADLYRGLASP